MPKYFAYGSNLSPDQICERCPSHRFISTAELRDYKLAFTRFSKNRQCGVADIVKSAGGSVWGAVFEVSDTDMLAIDRHEGVNLKPPAYVRASVQVFAADGQVVDAITYEVFNKPPDAHAPNDAYLVLIVEGARKWSLPQIYQDVLTTTRSQS